MTPPMVAASSRAEDSTCALRAGMSTMMPALATSAAYSYCRWPSRVRCRLAYSDAKVANRNVRDFGWEIAHEAVSRRPPISLDTIVARTHMYTYSAKVWPLCIFQGSFSVAPCQTLTLRFATFASLYSL
jgi:hypothetical protein